MKPAIKIASAVILLIAWFFVSVVSVSAAESVENQTCKEGDPWIDQCTSSDSFTVYRCQRPSCKDLAKTAEEVGQACRDKYGIKNECVLPLANEFAMGPGEGRDWNNKDDAEVEREYRIMEAECEEPTTDGGKRKDYDPCCAGSLFSGARACSAQITKAREAVEACRYDDVQYTYKSSPPVPCGGCTPGKIIEVGDVCYEAGSVAGAPARITPEPEPPYVPALVETAPTEGDIALPVAADMPPLKFGETAVAEGIDGNVDMQLADGSWVSLENGSVIPSDAKVFTGYDVRVTLRFANNFRIQMESLTKFDMSLWQTANARNAYIDEVTGKPVLDQEIRIENGALRFKVVPRAVLPGFDFKVSTPRAIAGVVGTDFAVAHDKDTGISIVEIYDGAVEVTNIATGDKKTITSAYGDPIQRIEIGRDDIATEKIAISRSEWDAFAVSRGTKPFIDDGEEEKTGSGWFFIILLALLGGLGFRLYEKGVFKKFMPPKPQV